MGKIAEIMLLQQTSQPALICEYTVSETQLLEAIGTGFTKIAAYMQELGLVTTDVPFVCYPDYEQMTPEKLRVIVGLKTATSLPCREEIQSVTLPERKIVMCMHRGDYNELASLYVEMAQWIKQQGYQQEGSSLEYYYTGPDVPVSEHLTRVELPLL